MVLLVLEAHRALHFSYGVDETAQRIAGQRVEIAARVHIFELPCLGKTAFRVDARKQKAFNLIRCVQRVPVLVELLLRQRLQQAARVARIGAAVLIDHVPVHQDFAGAENIRGPVVKRAPVNPQPQIALLLRCKSANRRAVEGQVLVGLQKKLLVVIEHVQAAFQIGEQHRDRLHALVIREKLQPLLLNLVGGHALFALILCL